MVVAIVKFIICILLSGLSVGMLTCGIIGIGIIPVTREIKLTPFLLLIMGFVIICGLHDYNTKEIQKIRAESKIELENALENQYEIYVNGIKVDINTIDIDAYDSIKIDDENKYIIITQ